jgi:hypothetical protein
MRKILFVTLALIWASFTNAQGCSDAGICSIGHGFRSIDKDLKNSIEVATIFAAGDFDVNYFSPFVSYTRQINEKIQLSTKLTYSVASGSFGKRGAFGDAFISGNYSFKEQNNKQWSALIGWKIPFTSANLKINGYSLPLDYQSSLGTFDLFLGTNFKYKRWDFNAVVQIPVFNNNKNSYFAAFSGTDDFPTTNLFERKSDALFRTSYTLNTKNQKLTFRPNVLFIYHLGEDSFENRFGKRESFDGSQGLTVNGNLISTYNYSKQKSIELSLASPFVVRDIRPDGLTRSFVLAIQYRVLF